MSSIRYTHCFDLLFQLVIGLGVLMVGGVVLANAALHVLSPAWEYVSPVLPDDLRAPFEMIGIGAVWIGCLGLLYKAVLEPLCPLPTWLYLRIVVRVPATWCDAEDTAFLFDGGTDGKWYPLTALRKVPRQYRREVLHEFADRVRSRTYGIPRPRPEHYVPPRGAGGRSIPRAEEVRVLQARHVLGIRNGASEQETKDAYRRLMKKYHPDMYAGAQQGLERFATEKAKQLNEAYRLLMKTGGPHDRYV